MMTPVLNNWNIVVVGSWNTRVFNVKWLGEFVFHGSVVNAALSLVPGYPNKYMADGLEVMPSEDRLLLSSNDISDAALGKLEDLTREILGLLLHTPIRAVGVNMTYRINEPTLDLLNIFRFNDDSLLTDNDLFRSSCSITRTFPADKGLMNIVFSENQGVFDLQFNFHCDVENAEQARSFLESRLVKCKEMSLTTASAVYKLDLGGD
jgi:hypothetical protein